MRSASSDKSFVGSTPPVGGNVNAGVVLGVPYAEIHKEIVERGKTPKKLKNAKQFLSTMRNYVTYVGAGGTGMDIDPELMNCLASVCRELSDGDSERKMVRLLYAIFSRYSQQMHAQAAFAAQSQSAQAHSQSSDPYKVYTDLLTMLQEEFTKHTGSRQALAYRTLGIVLTHTMMLTHTLPASQSLSHAQKQYLQTCCTILTNTLKSLSIPTKSKGSLFGRGKADKDYDTSVGIWTCLLSAYRRVCVVVGLLKPGNNGTDGSIIGTAVRWQDISTVGGINLSMKEVKAAIVAGSQLSDHVSIARHALILLGALMNSTDFIQKELLDICDHVSLLIKSFTDRLSPSNSSNSSSAGAGSGSTGQVDLLSVCALLQTVSVCVGHPSVPLDKAADMCAAAIALARHSRSGKI